MGKTFRKAVLAVNSYQSGDGAVTVTTDRLRHWEDQFKRLTAAGYAVPMHFNHADLDDPEMLSPIAMDVLSRRESRGAHNTEGKLADFKVSPDGKSAEITVEILTPTAREKVESNSVYVSPVIFPEFRDGHGQTYTDVITSVDLVDYPVDHSQGPFLPAEPALMGCAIRMGIKPTYYQPRAQRMDLNGMDSQAGSDTMAPPQADMGGGDVVSRIVAVLNELGIALPEDTNEANIEDRLRQVLGNGGQGAPMGGTTVASPEIQTMSLIGQVRRQQATLNAMYQRELVTELESLRDSGRITDQEFSQQCAKAGTMRMSVDTYGKNKPSDVAKWIESRKPIPEGTFQTATFRKGRESKLARMSVAQPPEPGVITPERAKELASYVNSV
jgi:hypothetical protein